MLKNITTDIPNININEISYSILRYADKCINIPENLSTCFSEKPKLKKHSKQPWG